MPSLETALQVWRYAEKGCRLRDKCLSFLLAGLGKLGTHRVALRGCFIGLIRCFARGNRVDVRLEGRETALLFSMRTNDVADYLTGGEMVSEQYRFPPITPVQIVDGGANIGAFAIQASSAFPEAELLCYEPDRPNLEMLEENLDQNHVSAAILASALWSSRGRRWFQVGASNMGRVSETETGVEVDCVTPPSVRNPCWFKLDIEGGEYEVLPYLFENSQFPDFLTLEIHHYAQRGKGLINLLRANGYKIEGGEDPEAECCVVTAMRNRPS